MRHRDRHRPRPGGRPFDNRRVEHWDERVRALDRKPLGVGIGPADESLEPIDLRQSNQNGLLLLGCERAREGLGRQQLAEPFPLVFFRQVRDLDAQRGRVPEPQPSDDICGRGHVGEAQCTPRHQIEVALGDPVKLGGQLRRAEGRSPERVERHGEMAVGAGRLHEGGRARRLLEQDGVRRAALGHGG